MLERIDEDLWVAKSPQSFMGLQVGTRMTVVRLPGAGLWVHSPIAPTPELRAAVDALGTVEHLVAPSLYHHLRVGDWASAYPQAAVHGPAALARKRKELRLTSRLEDAAAAPWASALVPVRIDGCMLEETVFVHGATRTVVSSDLTENWSDHPHWPTRAYLKMSGVYGKVGWPAPLRIVYRDRPAARRSIAALLEHDFDRVLLAHGDVIVRGGKDAVRQTFEFLG
jgi:hypothetical protein